MSALRRPRHSHVRKMKLVNIWICISRWSHKPDSVGRDGKWTVSTTSGDSVSPVSAVGMELCRSVFSGFSCK